MSTHAIGSRSHGGGRAGVTLSSHWAWLGVAAGLAFALPYLLTDVLTLDRDVFYGVYAVAVFGLLVVWSRSTGYDLVAALRRRLPLAVALGAVGAGALVAMVLRTEPATPRPHGLDLAAALAWRGVVYGVTDGMLLSVFPILAVFAALGSWRLAGGSRRTVATGIVAIAASLVLTAAYHAGYSDFRSAKLRKPLAGDLVWSVPTLVTLNPVGAPIAHAGMHVAAVLHSYDTDTFLPPHR